MRLILSGYGKMGRVVEEVAAERGLPVLDRFTRGRPLAGGAPALAAAAADAATGSPAVVIDFSVGPAVAATVRAAARLSLPLVIGTTGWQEQLDEVRAAALAGDIGVVWGSNFSLGVNVFYRVVERAAEMLAGLEGYDPFIHDWHHRFKLDSPSGTAIELRRRMAAAYGGREVPIGCTRAGYIPSAHSVTFDSAADTLHLEHRARNRRGLAEGALLAAGWIAGRRGFHSFSEVMDDLLPAPTAAPADGRP